MIKKGYLADLALLSEDYLNVDDSRILNIRSELTVLNGKVVYGVGSFRKYAPEIPKAITEWSPVNYYNGHQDPQK
jgi:hypothetical protein